MGWHYRLQLARILLVAICVFAATPVLADEDVDPDAPIVGAPVGEFDLAAVNDFAVAGAPQQVFVQTAPDLNLRYIARTPRYPWNETKKWPSVGETVTFQGHVANRGSVSTGTFTFTWWVDGTQQASGSFPNLAPGQEAVLTFDWAWQDGVHTVRLVLDPANAIAEVSEQNNEIEDRTNGLALGIWVEQSFYDFFNQNVARAGWGGNSFDDWLQRHVSLWNAMFAAAKFPLIAPNGILDRVRLDKVVRVPDGALNCNSNRPAVDYEMDLIWGFSSEMVGVPSAANCSWTPRYRDDQSTWDRDLGLIHELNHARYHIDLYGFNLDAHPVVLANSISAVDTQITANSLPDILEFRPPAFVIVGGEIIYCTGRSGNSLTNCVRGAQGTTARPHTRGEIIYGDQIRLQDGEGNALVGSAALPNVGGFFHRGAGFGVDIMNNGDSYGVYSAYVWNRIAGQRPVCGNYNAPCNLGEFLTELPLANEIELRTINNMPIAGAWIEVYRAKPYPVWYGKTFEGPPDFVVVTDANGRANLGPKPFGDQIVHTYGHANGLLALLIKTENKVGVKFLEVTEFNLAYGRGDRQRAVYPVVFTNYKTVTTPFILRRVFLPLVMR